MIVKVFVDGLIFDSYPHGGIARIYRELLPRVADLYKDIEIRILIRKAADNVLPKRDRIEIMHFKPWNYRPSRIFSQLNRLRQNRFDQKIQQWKPTVFHSTYYTSSLVPDTKSVVMVYDLIDEQFPFMMPNGPGFVARQETVIKRGDMIIGISHATTESAIARFGINRNLTTTIHLDASSKFEVLSEERRRQFREEHVKGRSFYLFVGSTGSYKNLGTLIRAFAEMRDETDRFLLLAGHSMEQLEPHFVDLAVQGRVENRIVRLVHPDDELLCQAYNAADAFVFPSLQEGFGIPLVEAMRCGTPVVASDIPVFREICGEAALFFDPHDHEALARQLVLVRQPGVRERLMARGFERAKRFSWDRAAEQLAEIYLRLAGTS
jgi:glycosyltransferase involved in cell wall biosynthesis